MLVDELQTLIVDNLPPSLQVNLCDLPWIPAMTPALDKLFKGLEADWNADEGGDVALVVASVDEATAAGSGSKAPGN